MAIDAARRVLLSVLTNWPATLESVRLWAHERTPNITRNVDDLEKVEFADVLGAIAEDHHLDPMCSGMLRRYSRRS